MEHFTWWTGVHCSGVRCALTKKASSYELHGYGCDGYGSNVGYDDPSMMSQSDDDDIMEDDWFPPDYHRGKRKSVCGESINPADLSQNYEQIVHPKTEEQKTMLRQVVQQFFLFQSLGNVELEVVINAMSRRECTNEDVIITQGDDGDNFYVVESGVYNVFVHGNHVHTYNNCGSFGELALMYNCPRAATICCVNPGVLWALDRVTFTRIMLKHAMQKHSLYDSFIQNTPILKHLNEDERSRLVDALEPVYFGDGEQIIRQGDRPDAFYFVASGMVVVTVSRPEGEVRVVDLHKGAYFGELALITNKPRAANVYASGSVTCARLSTTAFERLLGSCIAVMRGRIPDYEQRLQELLGPAEGGSHLGLG